jgi:hypothetical protein
MNLMPGPAHRSACTAGIIFGEFELQKDNLNYTFEINGGNN